MFCGNYFKLHFKYVTLASKKPTLSKCNNITDKMDYLLPSLHQQIPQSHVSMTKKLKNLEYNSWMANKSPSLLQHPTPVQKLQHCKIIQMHKDDSENLKECA